MSPRLTRSMASFKKVTTTFCAFHIITLYSIIGAYLGFKWFGTPHLTLRQMGGGGGGGPSPRSGPVSTYSQTQIQVYFLR
jgi:hypothetical protein